MSAPAGEGVPLSDEQLLLDALYREPGTWAKLTARMDPFLWSIAHRRLPDLPADIQGEFLQEVWMRVASRAPSDFDPEAQSAREFIVRFASAAINNVRADYCPPGRRTRDRSRGDESVPLAKIGLLEDERAVAEFDAAAARVDLERLMTVADAVAREGLQLMMDEDITVAAASRRIGMPRETYRRHMLRLPSLLLQRM